MTFANICLANTVDYRYQKAFKVQRLSLADGLSQSAVSDIIQDENGYIWLATEDGLNRYDSYDFEIFRHDFLNDNSIHENWVVTLLEEPGVGIWIGTARGISFYDPVDKSFTNFTEQDTDLQSYVSDLHMDQNGVIWVATTKGLFFIDKNRKKIERFISAAGQMEFGTILSITDDGRRVYASGAGCILQIDLTSLEMVNLCEQNSLEEIKDIRLNVILVNKDILWIGSSAGLYRYDLHDYSWQNFHHDNKNSNSLNDNYVQDLLFDSNDRLWVATTEGVSAYDQNKQIFKHYTRQIYAEDGLSSNDVLKLFSDEDGLMWLGTYTGGVNILDPNQNRFDHILTRSDVANLGRNNTIHAIEKDSSDNLWLGSYGAGLFRYNLLSAELSKPLNDALYEYDKFVYSLMLDSKNRLWIASLEELNLLDLNTNTIAKLRFTVDGNVVNSIFSVNRLLEDANGSIYIGMTSGLFKIVQIAKVDGITEINLHDMTEELPKEFTLYSPSISSIVQDREGDFWFGGEAGLIYYQVKLNQWDYFKYSKGNLQSLSNDNVQVIFEDSQGFIWVGTGDGLNQVVKSTLGNNSVYFKRITAHDGLPSNAIYGILEDDNNQLWLSTNSGIVKYKSNSPVMEIYKEADGISSNEFNTGGYFVDENGWLYFGSIDGVTVIKNDGFKRDSKNIRLEYAKISIGQRQVNVRKLNSSFKPTVVQGADEVSINVRMVNINYEKLGTQRYRYRINGVSDKWTYLGTQRDIFITGLTEGDYDLQVQSRLIGNDWSAQSKSLKIVVSTSFWNSNHAFYLIVFGVLSLFIAMIYYVSIFYRRKLILTGKKIDRESLRLKEIRNDKKSLGEELASKETEVAYLQSKVRLFEHKLDSEKYRDVATGFYKLSYITKLVASTEQNTKGSKVTKNLNTYQSITVIELTDFFEMHKTYEFLALAEFLSKVSKLIKEQMAAECPMFFVREGVFMIINVRQDPTVFEQSLIELYDLIKITHFEFANGISESVELGITCTNIAKIKMDNKSDMSLLASRILKLHGEILQISDKKASTRCYNITIQQQKKIMSEENEMLSFSELVQHKIIRLSELKV